MFPLQTREQEELEEALEVERQENEQRRLLEQKEEQLQQMMKRKNKQALLDELVSNKTGGFECSIAEQIGLYTSLSVHCGINPATPYCFLVLHVLYYCSVSLHLLQC